MLHTVAMSELKASDYATSNAQTQVKESIDIIWKEDGKIYERTKQDNNMRLERK